MGHYFVSVKPDIHVYDKRDHMLALAKYIGNFLGLRLFVILGLIDQRHIVIFVASLTMCAHVRPASASTSLQFLLL